MSLDSRLEFEPIAKSQWFIKFMTQLYLYTAWRTVISFGELRENRESGGEAAAKRREAPSGQWDKMRSCPVKERTGVIPQETHNG